MSSRDARIDVPTLNRTPLDINVQAQIKALKHNDALPVSKLHLDVLSNIFLLCQRTGSIEEQYAFPRAVSHVCKQWRATAFSTPLLWTTILLSRKAYNLLELEAYLIRSGICFLDIYISLPTHAIRAVVELLIICCRRWRRLYIHGGTTISNLLLQSLREVYAPALECLYLASVGICSSLELPATRPTILQNAPSLRLVHLSGPLIATLQLPLTNVTTLELSSKYGFFIKPADFVHFIGGLRTLVNLSFCFVCLERDDPGVVTLPVTLPLLRALRIGKSSDKSPLSLLVLPFLETLALQGLYNFHPVLLLSVKNLNLEQCQRLTNSTLVNLARSCPSITHLDIDNFGTYKQRCWTSTHDILWPSLQKISVRNISDACLSTLGTIVPERIARGHPLKEVFLSERSRIILDESGRFAWFEEHVRLTFSDTFETWSTVSGFDLPPLFADSH